MYTAVVSASKMVAEIPALLRKATAHGFSVSLESPGSPTYFRAGSSFDGFVFSTEPLSLCCSFSDHPHASIFICYRFAVSTLVIIPTYNEAATIGTVLQQVMAQPGGLHVLVVDDGSPDGTAQHVQQIQQKHPDRVFLMERTGKQGLGSAYRDGFRFALERDYTCICEMDADLSHDPDDLPRLIEPVAADQTDLAIGSRYIDGVRVIDWPLPRLVLSYGAGMYTRAITRMPIQDVTAGFKCFHRRVPAYLDFDRVRSNGYAFQVEMHFRTWRAGFRIQEIPVIFTERSEGQSKMSKAIVREAAWKVWELRLRDLIGRL